jgi:hypothetical protein
MRAKPILWFGLASGVLLDEGVLGSWAGIRPALMLTKSCESGP